MLSPLSYEGVRRIFYHGSLQPVAPGKHDSYQDQFETSGGSLLAYPSPTSNCELYSSA